MTGPIQLGVLGTSRPADHAGVVAAAHRLGTMLPAGRMVVLTGACGGYPDALAAGFRSHGGHVVGYSPGSDLDDHVAGGSPVDNCDEMLFGFGGLIERQVALVRRASVVLALGGNVGTLSELCIAVKMKKPMVIVQGFPGIGPRFMELLDQLTVYPTPRIRMVSIDDVTEAVTAFATEGDSSSRGLG
ncbi:MAG: hypothetical protein ACKOTB_00480 [Planctomycetia bacterium]